MFVGHVAAGLMGKRVAPNVSLGLLILASMFIDLLWPVFMLTGLEHASIVPYDTASTHLAFEDYPISHSLLTVIGWSMLVGVIYFLFRRNRLEAAVVGSLVLSHWILDLIVHRPDLPLIPGSDTVLGFGLWNSIIGTLVIEGGLYATGVWLYVRATTPRNRAGTWGFWSLIVIFAVLWLGNMFGPPPPSLTAVTVSALIAFVIFIPGFWWVDQNRDPV
jgi:hypothetical protein